MATSWWQFPITQGHGENNEQGVDFGTPFHTPLTPILPGTVQRVDCSSGWRCEIDIATNYLGERFTETFLHVDQPYVRAGQQVNANTVLGLSGGQLEGGANPDDPQFSSGPHVEFDMFRGSSPWQGAIDPTALARGGPQGGTSPVCNVPVIGGVACGAAGAAQGAAGAAGDVAGGLGSLAQALDPARALQSLSGAVTGDRNINDFLLRFALVFMGLVLLGFGLLALIQSSPQVQEQEQEAAKHAPELAAAAG